MERYKSEHAQFQGNPSQLKLQQSQKSPLNSFVSETGMHLSNKLNTDCKEKDRTGKFAAHQIKNKSPILKKQLCGQVTFFAQKFVCVIRDYSFSIDLKNNQFNMGSLQHMGVHFR